MKKLISVILLLSTSYTHAAVTMLGTRVIYPEASKGVNVVLTNGGSEPFIVQSWVAQHEDDGSNKASQENQAPFIVTPPIVKIPGGREKQQLKITYTHQQLLPQDRESIFYFNFIEVPYSDAVSTGDVAASGPKLQIVVRHQLKLFYRPTAVGKQVRKAKRDTSIQAIQQANQLILRYHNNSPFYLSTAGKAKLQAGEQNYSADGTMIAPYSQHDFIFPKAKVNVNKGTLTFSLLNDLGIGLEESHDVYF